MRVESQEASERQGVREEVEEEASDSSAVTGYHVAFRRNTLPTVQDTEAGHFFPLLFYLVLT